MRPLGGGLRSRLHTPIFLPLFAQKPGFSRQGQVEGLCVNIWANFLGED